MALYSKKSQVYGNIETAYAEEIVGALVDEAGDLDFSRTHTYAYHNWEEDA